MAKSSYIGRGYVYKIGTHSTAAFKTDRLEARTNLRLSFWANVAAHPENLMDVSGLFRLSVASAPDNGDKFLALHTVMTTYTEGWQQYKVDFCHSQLTTADAPYVLQFEFVALRNITGIDRVNVAIDEIISTRPEGQPLDYNPFFPVKEIEQKMNQKLKK